MDLKKAFDLVPRQLLFAKLEAVGARGRILKVIKDLYWSNSACVRIGNYTTEPFCIESGVMQGSKLGPILFIIFINDLLKQLHNANLGVQIWNMIISVLGFADDIILLSQSAKNLQKLIDICAEWSKVNGMKFNISKCKVMVLNGRKKQKTFTMDNIVLDTVKNYKYLGIKLSSKRLTSLITNHISYIIEKAEKRINCIKHLGFHCDGLRPETSIEMYRTLVRPILEYAGQVLTYKHHYLGKNELTKLTEPRTDLLCKLENFQKKVLKKLIPCPKSTPPALLRIMMGTAPMVGRVEMLKLRYFWRCLHTKDKTDLSRIIFEYYRKCPAKIGYVREVFNICCKYNYLNAWVGFFKPGISPLREIRRVIEKCCFKKDLQKALKSRCLYSTLFIEPNIANYKYYKMESFLKRMGNFPDAKSRRHYLYALLDPCKIDRSCPKCHSTTKDIISHILGNCTKASQIRLRLRLQLLFYGVSPDFDFENKTAVFKLVMNRKIIFLKTLCSFLNEIGSY